MQKHVSPFPFVAGIATAAFFYLGTGLHPVWWLCWFAPLPVLLASTGLGSFGAFWLATLAWFVGSLNMWDYLLTAISLPVPIVFLASALPACLFGLAVSGFRRFVLRGALRRAVLTFVALSVDPQAVGCRRSRQAAWRAQSGPTDARAQSGRHPNRRKDLGLG